MAPVITHEKVKAILGHMTPMTNFVIACARAGVPLSTATKWLQKGREMPSPDAQVEDRALYVELARGVEVKVAEQEADWLTRLITCDKQADDYKRYAWLLERRFARYRPHKNVDKVVKTVDLSALSTEELMKMRGDE